MEKRERLCDPTSEKHSEALESTETGKRVMTARAEGSREHGDVYGILGLPEAKNSKGRFPKVNYRLESGCDGKFYALHILLP